MKIMPPRFVSSSLPTIFMMLFCLGGCQFNKGAPLQLTGTVIDKTSGMPIEGAYVVTAYQGATTSPYSHASIYCVKTLGMITGVDGRYHFPVVYEGVNSPTDPQVLKKGYHSVGLTVQYPDEQANPRLFYTGHNVLLEPQAPDNPQLHFDLAKVSCPRAATQRDAQAGMEFLRMALVEAERINATYDAWWLRDAIEEMEPLHAKKPKQ